MLLPRLAESSSIGKSPLEEWLPSIVVASSPEFALASPMISLTLTETIALVSPVVPSTILMALKVAQSSLAMIDMSSILLGCS
jgi:hypothetical protein